MFVFRKLKIQHRGHVIKDLNDNKITELLIKISFERGITIWGSDVSNFIGSDQKVEPYHLVIF